MNVDKMAYMYQNPGGVAAAQKLSGKERIKRIRTLQEFKESCNFAIMTYETANKAKPRVDLED